MLVYVEPTGIDAQGQRHLERRRRAPRPALRGRRRPGRQRQRAPDGRRRLDDDALGGRGQQADAAHVLPARRAARQRRHQPLAFPGKRVMFQRSRVTAVVGGPNNGVPYDFRYWAPQLYGRSIWQSVSNCGLAGASTIDADTFHVSASAFPCAGVRRAEHRGPRGRARRPRQRVHAVRRGDALPGLGQRARPARHAELRLRPTRARATCSSARPRTCCAAAPMPDTLPATAQTCSSFVSAGVKLDRVIVQQGDGRQALVTDTWSATDGRHHQIDVFYEDRLGGTAPVVSFPWAGGFTSYPPGYTQKPPASCAVHVLHARIGRRRSTAIRPTRRARSRCRTGRPRCASAPARRSGRSTCARSRPQTSSNISFGFSWATIAGRPRDARRPGRARARADALPRPEPRRQDAHRRRSACCSPGHCKVGKVKLRDLASKQRKDHVDPAGPPARHHARGRQRRGAARQLAPASASRRRRATPWSRRAAA